MQEEQRSARWKKQRLQVLNISPVSQDTDRGINFLNDYKPKKKSDDDSCSRLNEIMKTPALRKSNKTSEVPLTHRWQRWKKSNSLLYFWVLNLKSFSMNSAVMGSQEQTMMNSAVNSASVFHLWLLEAFPWFQNGASIRLVNAEHS